MSVNLRSKIVEEFKRGALAFLSEGAICERLHVRPSDKKTVKKILSSLVESGILLRDNRGNYATPKQLNAFEAEVSANERGFAFLIPCDKEKFGHDFFVPRNALAGALNKDKVLAAHVPNTQDEAFVIRILSRGVKRLVGLFDCDRRAGYVIPDDRKFADDIYIKPHNFATAKRGDKVVVEIIDYARGKMPEGKIVEVLGEDGDFFVEEHAIIRSYGLYEDFPFAALRECEEGANTPVLLKGRRDLRHLYTVTIDGEDTRDIDDAISLHRQGENIILGVHIADVAEYVKPHSKTDKEAYRRGTSVYFPDRVLPMLPKALSNGACSLNEGELRYALSCLMTFDGQGNRLGYELCESVIKSDRRLSYPLVNALLNGDENARKTYPDFIDTAVDMLKLSRILQNRRNQKGAVNLQVNESKIMLLDGEIIIPDYKRGEAENLIEQFMVAANEAVADFAERKGYPILYRIHEPPAPEKASNLLGFLRDLGINAKCNPEDVSPADYSRILQASEGKNAFSVINKVMLRSMQKARYCQENKGHFGLASNSYCHFTSPIRRYPDLFTHRVLKAVLRGEGEKAKTTYASLAPAAATDTSERERIAAEAERAVDDLYACAYMDERIGETYEGVISGVTAFGVFVELPNALEGLIRMENLPQDDYYFHEEKLLLQGKKYAFGIGESIAVRVDACDYASRKVLFALDE